MNMKMLWKRVFGMSILFSLIFSVFGIGLCEEGVIKIKEPSVAGEFFGNPVSLDNYRFVKAAVMIFGSQWGGEPKTPEELEDRVWEDLLLSYEAYQRNIGVSPEELEAEISKLLAAEKVMFDRTKDRAAYEQWVKERVKEPVEAFENQLKHLIQLKNLRDAVKKSFQPQVTEEEALKKYLNEYNSLSLEFVQFNDREAAEVYYKKMKNPGKWEQEAKKNPKFAVRTGFVSLEFLIEVWQIPKEDAYAMLDLPVGSVYKPSPLYRGFAVFHTLEKRVADQKEFFEKKKIYFDRVKEIKQYKNLADWMKQLKKDAHIKVFVNPADKK